MLASKAREFFMSERLEMDPESRGTTCGTRSDELGRAGVWAVEEVVEEEDVVERGNTRGSLEMEQPESRLRTSLEVVDRETFEDD